MNRLVAISLAAGVFAAACWLTGRVRRYALARSILDIPNERSSHATATPRGGGIAIVVTTLAALVAAGLIGFVSWPRIWTIVGGGTAVAAIGFIDDHRHLARRWRLLGHFIAAGWVVALSGGLPSLEVFGIVVAPGWVGQAFAAVYLVWLLNLTNFMDGIDGIAAIEVITVTLGGVLLYLVSGVGASAWIVPLILAASTLGFLVWNWPPAKIFMGDAGSGFVGLLLGVLSLQAGLVSSPLLWSWLILLGVFIVDATVTLIRRVMRGDRVYEAHRTHAYQHAARRRAAHQPVTLAVAVINVAWLFPIALLVALRMMDGLTGVLLAYTPLVAGALWLGAGWPQTTPAQSVGRHV